MPMTFPNTPTEGQLHTTGGVQYQYSSGRWRTYPQQYEPVGAVATHEAASDPHTVYSPAAPNSTAITYNVGGTTTIPLDNGRTTSFTTTATGNTTFAMTGFPASGKVARFQISITNLGNYTGTWPAGWVFEGTPELLMNKTQVIVGESFNGGSTGRLYLIGEF